MAEPGAPILTEEADQIGACLGAVLGPEAPPLTDVDVNVASMSPRPTICRSCREVGGMKKMSVVAACLLLAWGFSPAETQEAPPSIWDGLFSEAQAQRGKEAYQASCAACHGDDLISVDPEAPSLTGPRFDVNWVGKTVAERFELTRKTMPDNDPGSLPDQTNIDIVAFILEFNGYPSGAHELGVDIDALGRIVIERAH